MSDIGAPSQPQKASAIPGRKTDPAERPNRTHRREGGEGTSPKDGEPQSEKKQTTTERGQLYRDPAVSIDAKTAHIRVGERTASRVSHRDSEGRPIIDTDKARFAVHPDAGLKGGDDIEIEITQAGQKLTADLLSVNGGRLDPPKEVELVVIATHQGPTYKADPSQRLSEEHTKLEGTADKKALPRQASPQPITTEETLETIASFFSKVSPQTPHNTADKQGLIYSTSTVHAADKTDPLILHTSSEDMKTLLNAQAKIAENNALANLSDLSRLPKVRTETSFQVLDLTDQARPVKFTLYPQGAQHIAASDTIIAQTPLQEQTLIELGLPHQNKRHPIYDVITQKGRFLAALPEALDLRGVKISAQPLIPTSTLSRTIAPNIQQAANIVSAQLFTADGARQAITLTLPEKLGPLLANTPPSSSGITQGQTTQNQVQTHFQAGVHANGPSSTPSGALATITSITQTNKTLSPTGQTIGYQVTTDQGKISFSLDWAGTHTKSQPLPFNIGDRLPFQTHDIARDAQQTAPNPSTLASSSAPAVSPTSAGAMAVPPLQTVSGWPALNFLSDLAPDQATGHTTSLSEDLAQLTARGGGNFTAALTHMLTASQQLAAGADPQTMLPQSVSQALQKGQEGQSFLDQWVKDVMSATGRQNAESTTDWRGMIIPSEPKDPSLSLFAFMFRDLEQEQQTGPDDQGDEDEEAAATKEFIIEVEFSEFGPLQVGGRLYPNRLDITITTHHALPEKLTESLAPLYHQALEQDKMTGHIHFNVADHFAINAKDFLMQ